jgi:catechol-2,3-dioxygenase
MQSMATDVPQLFRLNIEVGNLDQAEQFYRTLFAIPGRRHVGGRVYFDAGSVTLQIVDVSATGIPHPAAKALYFTVKHVDALHARAKSLNALSKEVVHGMPGGDVVMRPWGERSFYTEDPWGNPLCFVEAGTTYPG